MFIERPPQWFRLLFPGALFRMERSNGSLKRVFLTFDDGPIPEATPWVLDILDEFDVKATFFMVGDNVRKYPDLLENVMMRGHRVGNHTMHHIRGLGISPAEYLKDVDECETLTGSGLFRPPHGWLSPSQLRAIKKRYRVVMYDLVTRDYSYRTTSEEVLDNVKKFARDGSVIVFHDSLKSRWKLTTALPESLRWLKDQGYRFELL